MKPPPFAYAAPGSLAEALDLLSNDAHEPTVLAGGQSLMPLLNFRQRAPSALVDINRVPGLDQVEAIDDGVRIGALVRHSQLARSPLLREHCPLIARVVPFIAHAPVRNRGTLGGSVAHAHPAAELGAVVAAADGRVELASHQGARVLPFSDFVRGAWATARRPDELVTGVVLPSLAGLRVGFHEVTRREREFALAGAVAAVGMSEGVIDHARVALLGAEDAPRRLSRVEEALIGNQPGCLGELELELLTREGLQPRADRRVSGSYRSHLAGVAVARAVAEAVDA